MTLPSSFHDMFRQTSFEAGGRAYPVFRGGEGPGVVIIHEVPGITPSVAAFAERVVAAGFHVALPELLGTLGRPPSPGYLARSITRACISREFSVLASNRSSPVTEWLRALCRKVHADRGGRGVGALGMCLTGNFALAMMVEPCVMAPVLSQPSLPFFVTPDRRAGLHLSQADLEEVKRRVREEGQTVLGMRFSHDFMCPAQRFDRLQRELGDGFERIEVDSSRGNPHGIPRTAHSVVTEDLVDEEGHPTRAALDRVLAFFAERLQD